MSAFNPEQEAEVRKIVAKQMRNMLAVIAIDPYGLDPRSAIAINALTASDDAAKTAEEILAADTPLQALLRRARYPRK